MRGRSCQCWKMYMSAMVTAASKSTYQTLLELGKERVAATDAAIQSVPARDLLFALSSLLRDSSSTDTKRYRKLQVARTSRLGPPASPLTRLHNAAAGVAFLSAMSLLINIHPKHG